MSVNRRDFTHRGLAFGAFASVSGMLSTAQSAMDDVTLGKVLGPGPSGRCDDYAVGGGVVRWSDDHGKWLMWYYCRDSGFPKDVAPTLGSGRIALATSRDGIHWDRFNGTGFGGAIIEPSKDPDDFDSTHIGVLDVTRVEDKWYLWYLGGDHARLETPDGPGPKGYRMRTGLAVSDDGVSFKRVRGTASNGAALDFRGYTFTTWPNGIHDGEQFFLFYTTVIASEFQFGTEVATSKDGSSWQVHGPISWTAPPTSFETKGIMTRHVLANPNPDGMRWLMLYTALDGGPNMQRSIFAAESEDGLNWTRLYDEPIFEAGAPGCWDDGGVAIPQLTVNGNELRMYYFGFPAPNNPNTPSKGIGLAVSPNGDLKEFRRVSS